MYEYLEDALDVVKLPAARLQQDSRSVRYLVEVLTQTRAVFKIDSVIRFRGSTGCPFLIVHLGWVDLYLKVRYPPCCVDPQSILPKCDKARAE